MKKLKYRVRFLVNACRPEDVREVVVSIYDTGNDQGNNVSALLNATIQLKTGGISTWVHQGTERAADLES